MTSNKLKQIAISQENYLDLKRLGGAGDSFNDVITEVIKKVKMLQPDVTASDLIQAPTSNEPQEKPTTNA